MGYSTPNREFRVSVMRGKTDAPSPIFVKCGGLGRGWKRLASDHIIGYLHRCVKKGNPCRISQPLPTGLSSAKSGVLKQAKACVMAVNGVDRMMNYVISYATL